MSGLNPQKKKSTVNETKMLRTAQIVFYLQKYWILFVHIKENMSFMKIFVMFNILAINKSSSLYLNNLVHLLYKWTKSENSTRNSNAGYLHIHRSLVHVNRMQFGQLDIKKCGFATGQGASVQRDLIVSKRRKTQTHNHELLNTNRKFLILRPAQRTVS